MPTLWVHHATQIRAKPPGIRLKRGLDVLWFEGTYVPSALKLFGPPLTAVAGVAWLIHQLIRTEVVLGVGGNGRVLDRGGDGTPFTPDVEKQEEKSSDPPRQRTS